MASYDQRRVYAWLRASTRDEPHEAHAATIEIAKGVGLPEDRVRGACLSDHRIHRASGDQELWSVWRKEPQSIYDKRDVLSV